MKIEANKNDIINMIKGISHVNSNLFTKYSNLGLGYFDYYKYEWIWFDKEHGEWDNFSEQELIDIYNEIKEKQS